MHDRSLHAPRPDGLQAPARGDWSPARRLAVVAGLAAASWAGVAGLVLGAFELAEVEARYGLLQRIPFV